MSSHYTTSYSMSAAMPAKDPQYPAYSQYSTSPNECDETMSQTSGVPSGYSATTPGYMGSSGSSAADYDSSNSAAGVDFQEYMHDRSGKLNAKNRELMELQAQAQARLARTRERFQEGMRDAREVRADLEWTQKKVSSLQTKASSKHPKEYAKARARYPSPE
ncbi:biogenesis of lysosome-related organelles complex 1 subunit KXD1 [Geosmithia morbida]|uniref:Biogenesis of lysosome-related organelles complex 1 subunit KXD1 n=1 Tax=Geosmithia morbida TaxID=1094350 RepID=A0A9P4Z4A1_9HYPO|nr:biogenesis of lysosome-related organelles complex 1 subunit KXD1 [Geosmithia morbida]KAF4126374.1 biogenesis of lysosome-related organelles complex 1 subunit KXD1 [Geosmithia morbida]